MRGSSSEATEAKRATCSNPARITVTSERRKMEITLRGYEVQCCLGFFVWMGGFGGFFLFPCGTAQLCGLGSEREEFYPVLGLLVALAPPSISENPGVEDASPRG